MRLTSQTEEAGELDNALLTLGKSVIRVEAEAVQALLDRIDNDFVRACKRLMDCTGRIVVCGIGKSGHIGAKLAATFASTGSPAFFVHAAEAGHGDLGMFKNNDVLVGISYSGNSAELMNMIPGIKRMGIPVISLCGEPDLGLAPTASTTAALALGDALAVAILSAKGFSQEDFARSHPSGRLGRRLLLNVADIMVSGDELPVCSQDTSLPHALVEISSKGLGMVALVDEHGKLTGIFTDGDLRRTIEDDIDIRKLTISSIMTKSPTTIESGSLAINAVTRMQELKITSMPVMDKDNLVGVITMHALLAAGVV